ncbi:MAG: hypothetical protein JW795_04060 [Chitinivibrionales bacterium]|nr:hypothetical protein [Chitinivibrionales bacterium]
MTGHRMIRRDQGFFFIAAVYNALIILVLSVFYESGKSLDSVCTVQAYLDPSTGAMIISAIIGLFASIVLGLKSVWYKMLSPFRKKGKTPQGTPPAAR